MLLLILDLSGDVGLAETAREALSKETEALPPNTWLGLMRAQDGLRVVLDPTADRAELARAIRDTPPGSYAGLLDSVQTVMELADDIPRKSAAPVAVLYVTDSDVRRYREDFTNPVINAGDPRDLSWRFPEDLVREKIRKLEVTLAPLQAPLFVVHLDYRSDRLNEAYQAGLKQLAATTKPRRVLPLPGGNTRGDPPFAPAYRVSSQRGGGHAAAGAQGHPGGTPRRRKNAGVPHAGCFRGEVIRFGHGAS